MWNRLGYELPPRSWTNFKGFHEEVRNRVQAQVSQELFGSGWGGEAARAAVVGARGEDPYLGEPLPPSRR